MTRIIGYIRPSYDDQSIEEQLEQLKSSGVNKIYQEKTTAAKKGRPQLDKLLMDIREGDTVVVTSLDRIARNTKHLLEIIESFCEAGGSLRALDKGLNTSSQNGEALRMLLSAIVDFESQTLRERQAEGIARAKQEGRYKGRKPTARAKSEEVCALNDQGLTRQKIADELGIGVASVYRILKNNRAPQKSIAKTQKKPTVKKMRAVLKKKDEVTTKQLSLF